MALDAFLQFNDGGNPGAPVLDGETQDLDMKKLKPIPFDLSTWSFTVAQQVNVGSATGGIASGKVEFQPFSVEKQIDQASPNFFLALAQGGHFEQCSLFIRKGGGTDQRSGSIYLRFDFKMVFVTDIKWSHDDTAPKEAIQFDYGALRVTYTSQRRSGQANQAISTAPDNPGGQATSQWSKMLNTSDFDWKMAIPDSTS